MGKIFEQIHHKGTYMNDHKHMKKFSTSVFIIEMKNKTTM